MGPEPRFPEHSGRSRQTDIICCWRVAVRWVTSRQASRSSRSPGSEVRADHERAVPVLQAAWRLGGADVALRFGACRRPRAGLRDGVHAHRVSAGGDRIVLRRHVRDAKDADSVMFSDEPRRDADCDSGGGDRKRRPTRHPSPHATCSISASASTTSVE